MSTVTRDPVPGRTNANMSPTRQNHWSPPSITAGELAEELRAVVADVPWFFVTPFLRKWHRTWGATRAEVVAPMPGDDLLPHAQYRCTRAITIQAAPEAVWPWLVQVG